MSLIQSRCFELTLLLFADHTQSCAPQLGQFRRVRSEVAWRSREHVILHLENSRHVREQLGDCVEKCVVHSLGEHQNYYDHGNRDVHRDRDEQRIEQRILPKGKEWSEGLYRRFKPT